MESNENNSINSQVKTWRDKLKTSKPEQAQPITNKSNDLKANYYPSGYTDLLTIIANRRKSLNISQSDMGSNIGISGSAYSYLERGINHMSISQFIIICNALNITLSIKL